MGIPTLITTNTESGDSSSEFTSGIDSTYDEYMFVMTDINPSSNALFLIFNGSTDGGSNYNVTKTTTFFGASHYESGSSSSLSYVAAYDKAQATTYQELTEDIGSGADESAAGILHLFSPSNTTYVKHFYARTNSYWYDDNSHARFVAGYFNTTSAINAINFKTGASAFDGVIQMYGIS